MNYVKQLGLAVALLVVPAACAMDAAKDYASWTLSGFSSEHAKDNAGKDTAAYAPRRLGQGALLAGAGALSYVAYKKSPFVQEKVDAVIEFAKNTGNDLYEGKNNARAKATAVVAVALGVYYRKEITAKIPGFGEAKADDQSGTPKPKKDDTKPNA